MRTVAAATRQDFPPIRTANWLSCFLALSIAILSGCSTAPSNSPLAHQNKKQFTGPWDVAALMKVPPYSWGARTNRVQEVYFEGEPFNGKATRVFAYYARPDPTNGPGPFPAMVLVHGGGGKAFSAWADHWAQRGYAAIAMDLSGNGPNGHLPDGGPDQSDQTKFRAFESDDARNMWTYHSVAAAIRACSLLATQPEVDANRIGLTGISWGGYLTCIIAGLDPRIKAAVPVYGCGFLDQNSYWIPIFDKMPSDLRKRWVDLFDPSRYLPGVRCPILFLNGSNDFAYPLDSYQKSYNAVPRKKWISVRLRLPHGHIWTFPEVDAFVDSQLKHGDPVPEISRMKMTREKHEVNARIRSTHPITKAEFNFTTDTGVWQKRDWKSIPATVNAGVISAKIPSDRPLVGFLSVTDSRGVTITTPHETLE